MYSKKYILLFMISYIKKTSSIWYFGRFESCQSYN